MLQKRKTLLHRVKLHYCFTLVLLLLSVLTVHAAEYRQVAGLIDIRTTFSDGSNEIEDLTKLARDRGFQVIFFHDHDRMAMEYGLPLLRNIIKKKVERPSVNLAGAEKYLAAIEQTNAKYPDILVLPGIEAAPFYYWTGSLQDGLIANDWERHLLVMGLGPAQDY